MQIECLMRLPDRMPVLVIGYVEYGQVIDDPEVYFPPKPRETRLYEFPRELNDLEWERIRETVESRARELTEFQTGI